MPETDPLPTPRPRPPRRPDPRPDDAGPEEIYARDHRQCPVRPQTAHRDVLLGREKRFEDRP